MENADSAQTLDCLYIISSKAKVRTLSPYRYVENYCPGLIYVDDRLNPLTTNRRALKAELNINLKGKIVASC